MPFANAPDGTRLYYETDGKGEPLLLIAGRGNDRHVWNLLRGDLAKNYRVIVYDHRGTGRSDKPEQPPYSTPGFATDAVALLDHLELPRAHVYGISMGGRIAQWLGVSHAERVGALILGCTTPGGVHHVRSSPETDAIWASGDRLKILDQLFASRWSLPRFLLSMRQSGKYPTPQYAQDLHARASEAHDAYEQLPRITAPTLILHGDDDPVTPPANVQILAERIPGAELHWIRGGRHLFFIERRWQVNRLVKAFLTRHPLAP